MKTERFEDIIAWQKAKELAVSVYSWQKVHVVKFALWYIWQKN